MASDLRSLNFTFHLSAQFSIIIGSFCNSFVVVIVLGTCSDIGVSSAKSVVLQVRFDPMSLMYIKNKSGQRTEPCGTLAFISFHE